MAPASRIIIRITALCNNFPLHERGSKPKADPADKENITQETKMKKKIILWLTVSLMITAIMLVSACTSASPTKTTSIPTTPTVTTTTPVTTTLVPTTTVAPTTTPTPEPTHTPTPTPTPTSVSWNTIGVVASVPIASGAPDEYSFYLEVTSTTVSGITAGQQILSAASIADFPDLLTVGASLTGNLSNTPGWWVLEKASTPIITPVPTPTPTAEPTPTSTTTPTPTPTPTPAPTSTITPTPTTSGPAAVNLGAAADFVILAKAGISTTGTTAIDGNIGVSPIAATAITGFGLIMDASNLFSTSSLITGNVYAPGYASPTPANLTAAVSAMETAYSDAAGRTLPTATELGAGNIGGLTLAPGLYKWSTGVTIPTNITLSGGANDIWIFQIAQTLTVSSSVHINLSGGAQAKNIFWQVAGQTTLGTTSVFNGNILCQTAIVMNTGVTLFGRALAQTAVTLDASVVMKPD